MKIEAPAAHIAFVNLERSTMRQITWRLLPLITLLYFVAYIDRSNLSFAALTMNQDLGFGHQVFGLGASFFFVGYVVFQIPGNLALQRFGARRVIALIVFIWGLCAAGMGLVNTSQEFYLARFILGSAEAAFFPGMIFYIALWFPAAHRGWVMALFTMASPLSNVLGLPLSVALGELNGVLQIKGWQWVFLAEGIPAVLLAIPTWLLLTDRPREARWLSEERRNWLTNTIDREALTRDGETPRVGGVAALLDWRIWLLCIPYFAIIMGYYGLALWLPQIVKGFGHLSNEEAGLLSALPYVCALAALPWWGARIDRHGSAHRFAAGACLLACLSLAASAALGASPILALGTLCLASLGLHLAMPAFWTLPQRLLNARAAAAGIGLISALGHLGGFTGPILMGWLREITGDFQIGLAGLSVPLLIAVPICWKMIPARPQDSPIPQGSILGTDG